VSRFRTILMWTGLGLLVVLVAIQFVPYGRDHTNPTGGRQIAWDSPRTEQLMADACMDCHSNLTKWPWYSNVAPVSWLVQRDVDEGRRALNLSTGEVEVEEMIETIREGSMPPWQYKPTHPGGRLSDQEKRELIRGLEATFGAGGAGSGENEAEEGGG
jgi:mono/diheme cytochrome c family protein